MTTENNNTEPKKLDICNTCFCIFDDDTIRQSLSNRGYLATYDKGEIIQECCERCVSECEQE